MKNAVVQEREALCKALCQCMVLVKKRIPWLEIFDVDNDEMNKSDLLPS
jgi:hypothetical protein